MVGWGVHAYAAVDDASPSAFLVERSQQSDVPSRTCLHLIHDEVVQESLKLWTGL